MTTEILYRAAWVVPVTSPPIRDGFVSVRDGVITDFGPIDLRSMPVHGEIRDLGASALMPGFVNAHTHLELSHLGDGAAPGDRGFVPWIEDQLRLRGEGSRDDVASGVRRAIESLQKTGTVGLADVSNSLVAVEPLADSSLHALVLHEILGFDPAKAAAIMEQTTLQRATAVSVGSKSDRMRIEMAAHAPHSISRELFTLMMKAGGVKSIHVAESRSEDEFLRDGSGDWRAFLDKRVGPVAFAAPGTTPVQYLDELGVLRPGLLAVHCARVNADDAQILARRGAIAVLCPRSNEYLGNGVPPLALLLGSGVSIALGSDSLASCASLDVLDDARLLVRRFPRVPQNALLHALTRGGAMALGFPDLGEIRIGASARLAQLSFDGAVPKDPIAFLLGDSAPARGVA